MIISPCHPVSCPPVSLSARLSVSQTSFSYRTMQLSHLTATLDSQIPIVALDVLAPEELTLIEWLTGQIQDQLALPAYFWNLGLSSLEQCVQADGGLNFEPVKTYNPPLHADPLLFILQWIEGTPETGAFILGDIHPFIGKDSPHLSWEVLTRLKNLYHRLKPTDKRIILLGQNIKLHDSLIRLIPYCEMPLPTVAQIQAHVASYFAFLAESAREQEVSFQNQLTAEDRETLARAALSLTLEEISDFCRLVAKELFSPEGITVDAAIIPKVMAYKARLLKQMGIELGQPAAIPFGGLHLLREWLVRRRRLFTTEARQYHLPQPKGILLAGPPGTGKSLIAKNVAQILELPLLQLDLAGMLGSLVGESEGNLKRALKTAAAIAPCVLWIDEVEKALSGTQGDSSGVSGRILGMLLTFMSESNRGVFVVATCNDPTALPSEFKRRGRFDENFFIDLPTAAERVEVLKIHASRLGCPVPDSTLVAIAAKAEQFSGSELANLVAEAALFAFDAGRPQQVTQTDLESCLSSITPLAVQDAQKIQQMREWSQTARPASSPETSPQVKRTLKTAKMRV